MFLHRKELNVGTPNAAFGQFLLEQFGGATGELTAALPYLVQSFRVGNAAIRDMLQDIAIEEFSQLEMVGKLIAQHTSEAQQAHVCYITVRLRLSREGIVEHHVFVVRVHVFVIEEFRGGRSGTQVGKHVQEHH